MGENAIVDISASNPINGSNGLIGTYGSLGGLGERGQNGGSPGYGTGSGAQGGRGGDGGDGGSGGSGGDGGTGGAGVPGMLKLCASLIIADSATLIAMNGASTNVSEYQGRLTLISNMTDIAANTYAPTLSVAGSVTVGRLDFSELLMVPASYNSDFLVPILGQLADNTVVKAKSCSMFQTLKRSVLRYFSPRSGKSTTTKPSRSS